MSSNLIHVRATAPHMRGQRIAGAGGLVYWIHPNTGCLHQATGNSTSPDPGVDPDSADRFKQFAGFEVGKKPPPPPVGTKPPAPSPPSASSGAVRGRTPASSGSAADGDLPDSDTAVSGSLDVSLEASEPGTQVADQLPADISTWAIKRWISEAADLGISLTEAEASTRPKAKLVQLIRDKAAELDETK